MSTRFSARGFTLIELLVVLTLIAIATAMVSLSLRDTAQSLLNTEGERLSALFEQARAEARGAGLPVRWRPLQDDSQGRQFVFEGLPPQLKLPERWRTEGVSAEIVDAPTITLGPEPLIGVQRVVLSLGPNHLELVTDGLGPFTPQGTPAP